MNHSHNLRLVGVQGFSIRGNVVPRVTSFSPALYFDIERENGAFVPGQAQLSEVFDFITPISFSLSSKKDCWLEVC